MADNNNWFNPSYPPPPLPAGTTNNTYNPQTYYPNTWYNCPMYSAPATQQPEFVIPPPNFTQPPPPQVSNAQYQYDYAGYYHQLSNYAYGGGASSPATSNTSKNYTAELESYKDTKAHYDRAQMKAKNVRRQSRSRTRTFGGCSRERRRRRSVR